MSLPKAAPCPEEGTTPRPRVPAVNTEPSTARRIDALLNAYTGDNPSGPAQTCPRPTQG